MTQRNVIGIMDFLGNIGGVAGILYPFCTFIAGNYITFSNNFSLITSLYRIKNIPENE
jgi:hypothetical protein